MIGLQSTISFISMKLDWLDVHANDKLNLCDVAQYIKRTNSTLDNVVCYPTTRVVRLFHETSYTDVQITEETTNIEAYQTIVDAL